MSKQVFLSCLVVLLSGTGLCAEEVCWLTDFAQAQARARAENKLILAEFTGSDWCTCCLKQQEQVLNAPAFTQYARANLVLLKVDFPIHKKLPPEQRQANHHLKQRFNVRGLPTLVVIDANGKEVGRWVGYRGGGAARLIKNLDSAKAKAKK